MKAIILKDLLLPVSIAILVTPEAPGSSDFLVGHVTTTANDLVKKYF